MLKEKFNFECCTLRKFNKLVKHIDAFQNFIFAADEHGLVKVFLLNENDLENDEDTLKEIEI